MGRLIGIPYFLLPQAHDNKKANATTLRKVKKEVSEMDDNYFPSKNNLVCCIHINASLRMQKQFEGPYHFYVDYRMACAFTFEGPMPKILSFCDWAACHLTKINVTAHVIQNHLMCDDVLPAILDNGFAVFPSLSPSPILTQTMESVIFQLFPSLRKVLVQVSPFFPT